MAAARQIPRLVDRLPPIRGRYSENVPLAGITWFGVGGPAEVVFRPKDAEDLAQFLALKPADVPILVLGVGSNLLVRDGGIPGVVIRLGRHMAAIAVEGERIVAGAGALDLNVARVAGEAGLAGLEFLCGIPGTIGGALRMNAGAYGRELSDVLIEARALAGDGTMRDLSVGELGLSYRHCRAPGDWIFTSATLRGQPDDPQRIAERMEQIRSAREVTQPVRSRTGGSTFANPAEGKAWELIEKAGCRGLRHGGATVSEKHCNFLINSGDATAADLEELGEEVRRRVLESTGVHLRWEIHRVGIENGPSSRRGGT
ncbi:MAG: UDP-N-acetylmuramate dehydrogenase [Rhodospirillales bacterium]|nr:UDP-N-acetylmuramate dehydrogenase [Rhodospirillales bacterium]